MLSGFTQASVPRNAPGAGSIRRAHILPGRGQSSQQSAPRQIGSARRLEAGQKGGQVLPAQNRGPVAGRSGRGRRLPAPAPAPRPGCPAPGQRPLPAADAPADLRPDRAGGRTRGALLHAAGGQPAGPALGTASPLPPTGLLRAACSLREAAHSMLPIQLPPPGTGWPRPMRHSAP